MSAGATKIEKYSANAFMIDNANAIGIIYLYIFGKYVCNTYE